MHSQFDSALFRDRVEFKLFAAERHLKNLKEIQLNYPNLEDDSPLVQVELEIDCFLTQVLGAVDCLLILINTRLELGIATGKVDAATVQSALNARTKNISLLTELHQALEHDRWLWTLIEFRNETMQRPFVEAQALVFNDESTIITSLHQHNSKLNSATIVDKNLIAFFEQSAKRLRELINTIRMKESLLK